jgi:hypothetical protein
VGRMLRRSCLCRVGRSVAADGGYRVRDELDDPTVWSWFVGRCANAGIK